MSMSLRASMDAALKEMVVPVLRNRGFKGSLPHFRRLTNTSADLLSFQFDKWGGGFIVEIASCSIDGFTTHWGKYIPVNKLTAHDIHPNSRKRIQPAEGGGVDAWFRFDVVDASQVARSLLEHLSVAEPWWQEQSRIPTQANPSVERND